MATLKVLTSNGQRTVMAALLPAFEQSTGHRVEASYDPGQIMMRRIASGETADVVLLGGSALAELSAQGKLLPGSLRPYSRCGVGVAVSAGLPLPDIGTVEALKRALLAAPAVAYTIEGASGIHFAALIERLGIAREVEAKALRQPGGLVGELVARGTPGLAIQQIPELMAVPGITLVGPLPAAVQKISETSAAAFAASAHPGAALALLKFLSTPDAMAVVRKMGHESA